MSEPLVRYGCIKNILTFDELNINFQEWGFDYYSEPASEQLLMKIWEILTDANLTEYYTDLEKTEVYLRLFAVIGLINDFIIKSWDFLIDNNFYYWYKELRLPLLHISHLISIDLSFNASQLKKYLENDYTNDDIFFENSLFELVKKERKRMHRILKIGFGSNKTFFIELWKGTCPYRRSNFWKKYILDDEIDILICAKNNLERNRPTGFEWVYSGCKEL